MAPVPTYRPAPRLRTPLDDFREHVSRKHNLSLTTYADLHAFSVDRLNDFWMTVWEYSAIKASIHPRKAVDENIPIDQFPRFFEDTKLNFAENILCRKDDGLAILSLNEDNIFHPEQYSWQDLRDLVAKYADAMKSSGLKAGDVVALVGGNCARSLVLLLATACVGGIFASFATDIGDKALNDRLGLLRPRFLFAESIYSYNGKKHHITTKIEASVAKLKKLGECETVVIGPLGSMKLICTSFESFLSRGKGAKLEFEQVPFNTPFVVMFSSGTTGTPKGIIHSQGGLVLNGIKEYLFHNNLGSEDVHYQFTSIGWTLWNIAIGALFVGSSIVLYDGSPFYPTPEGFLKALFKHGITSFGAGPRYYSELQKHNVKPKKYAPRLHTLVSTGAVLPPALAKWLVDAFGAVCQFSMSGGTELCGSFVTGTRSLPSYPGQMAVKALGMDVVVVGPDGNPLPDGESGELVCRKPFPNMPIMFWNDPDRKIYFGAYFTTFPHVWRHGDFIKVDGKTKGIYILGRSDGVLNPSGVRFGSSEIYNILSAPKFGSSITDGIVVGQQRLSSRYSDSAERLILFIKCTPSATTGTLLPKVELTAAIRNQIAKDLSRRHVPSFIFEVEEIPYNVNGKKLEIPVKAVLCGGEKAMAKMKVTEAEFKQIARFEKFYDIEQVVGGLQKGGAKL